MKAYIDGQNIVECKKKSSIRNAPGKTPLKTLKKKQR